MREDEIDEETVRSLVNNNIEIFLIKPHIKYRMINTPKYQINWIEIRIEENMTEHRQVLTRNPISVCHGY